ncbi:restriction endonuclease subunit S [Escherichia coli]|uniref:restriction endonuclease subunit S n=1 Tax=Escherichia coli TaxID=562 RepID=UPI000BE56492|nr:restriction endonuclease subunit S [Escherichia coli]
MSFELFEYKIEDLGKVITGKTPPSKISDAFSAQGIPFVTPKDMDGRRIIDKTERYLSSLGVEAVRNCLLPQNSIAVSCIGSDMGKTVLLPGESITNQQINAIIVDSERFDYKYVYYYLSTLQDAFKAIAGGSATPILNKGNFSQFKVSLPVKLVQNKIALILNSLDTKIEVNTEINQTLEQMAEALFKSWFVDFEPVKAKIAVLEAGGSQEEATLAAMTAISGKNADALAVFEREHPEQYAKLKATAELFPSAMQDSELGEIPEGWELKSFGDVSKCYDKKRIPLSKPQREKKKGEIPYYGATSIMDYVDEYIFDGIYLLLGEDGSVIKESGLPFTQYIWGKSWVNNHAHVLTGSGSVTTEHLMVFIKQENIAAYVTGAVQMKLNQKNMNSIPFIFADEAVNNVFGQRIDSIYAVIRAKSEENLTLTNLRDTLLPKLLSGEITLPEAEQSVSEAENV